MHDFLSHGKTGYKYNATTTKMEIRLDRDVEVRQDCKHLHLLHLCWLFHLPLPKLQPLFPCTVLIDLHGPTLCNPHQAHRHYLLPQTTLCAEEQYIQLLVLTVVRVKVAIIHISSSNFMYCPYFVFFIVL